jgi:hypothetical protein
VGRPRRWADAQLGLITTALDARELKATIVLDLVHVIEYLWKASRGFHGEGTSVGDAWVKHYLAMVLTGKAALAAAGMRRSATRQASMPATAALVAPTCAAQGLCRNASCLTS